MVTDRIAYYEDFIVAGLVHQFDRQIIDLPNGFKIWTMMSAPDPKEEKPALVLVHGFCGALGLWVRNLDALADHFRVYAFDLLGFGRSSRPKFPTEADKVEDMFIESIREWVLQLGLERFTLVGHSFGSYLACVYSIKHPETVEQLIMLDSWGIAIQPAEFEQNVPRVVRMVYHLLKNFSPLAVVRAAGSVGGPRLIKRAKQNFGESCKEMVKPEYVYKYIYHCNACQPSGEIGFTTMSGDFAFAKRPLMLRIQDLSPAIPLTMIHGDCSWVDHKQGLKLIESRPHHDILTQFQVLDDTGHHVYIDHPVVFNETFIKCAKHGLELQQIASELLDSTAKG